jgi:hypothetical protein
MYFDVIAESDTIGMSVSCRYFTNCFEATSICSYFNKFYQITISISLYMGRHGRDRMVSWIYNYRCNQCLSPLTLRARLLFRWGVLDTTSCEKVCQWLAAGQWFLQVLWFPPPLKLTGTHDITEILLKVALNTITLTHYIRGIPWVRHYYYKWNKIDHVFSFTKKKIIFEPCFFFLQKRRPFNNTIKLDLRINLLSEMTNNHMN